VTSTTTSGIQILKLNEGASFAMGKAISKKVVYPEMGAQHLTLNYGVHEPGMEFAQHIHAHSEDVIVCLSGRGVVRSGETLVPFAAGDVIYVPAGVVHGTINTGDEPLVMISCQAPPDLDLYRQSAGPAGNGRERGDA
jgi:mannose-6-phosphate isomerase-like protein (cupin superfamily)